MPGRLLVFLLALATTAVPAADIVIRPKAPDFTPDLPNPDVTEKPCPLPADADGIDRLDRDRELVRSAAALLRRLKRVP